MKKTPLPAGYCGAFTLRIQFVKGSITHKAVLHTGTSEAGRQRESEQVGKKEYDIMTARLDIV